MKRHWKHRLTWIISCFGGLVLLMGQSIHALQGQSLEDHSLFAPLITHTIEPTAHDYVALALVGLGNATEIYTFRADGTEIRRLTNNDWEERSPRFSPQKDQIAFWQRVAGTGEYPDIAQVKIMNLDGTNVRSVGTERDFFETGEVSWTSDGRYLIAIAGKSGMALIDVVSGNEVLLGPVWFWGFSPDERYVYRIYANRMIIHDISNPTVAPVEIITSSILWHPYLSELIYTNTDETVMAVRPDGSNLRVVGMGTGRYTVEGWLNGGETVLLMDYGFDTFYIVPFGGGDIVPYGGTSAPKGYFRGVTPHQEAIMYFTSPTTQSHSISLIYHPLTGNPITLQECDLRIYPNCSFGGISWSWDGSALTFPISYLKGGEDKFAVVYRRLDSNSSTILTKNDVRNPQFLPGSSRYGTGYEFVKDATLYLLDLPAGTQTPLVPELGSFVAVHRWYYVGSE